MRLNLNNLQYDEDACIFIEKRTNNWGGGIRTEKKYLKSWDEWENNHWQDQNNKHQDRIKRKIRQARRFVIAMREI